MAAQMALAQKLMVALIELYPHLFPDGPPKVQKKLSEEELKKLMGTIQISLEEIISTPAMLKLFRVYCTENFVVENIEFYLAAKEYKENAKKTGKADTKVAFNIFEMYVKKNAPNEINISDRERDATSAPFEKDPGEVIMTGTEFDKSMDTIWKLIDLNSYMRFKKSKYYDTCLTYRVSRMSRSE